jgi:hypothetical protein
MGFSQKDKYDYSSDLLSTQKKILTSLDKYGFESTPQLQHLIFSARNDDGLYSLNKLKQKFNKSISYQVDEPSATDSSD